MRAFAERGFAMAALLVVMSIMALVLSMAIPAWKTMNQREREAELFFRGQQYVRAITKYQAARGAYPPSVDVLVTEKFLRRKYLDPITGDDFEVVRVGQGVAASVQGGGGRGGAAAPSAQQPIGFRPLVTEGLGGGGGPILGVVSTSKATAFRVMEGRSTYNEMPFVATGATAQAGSGGTATPGGGANGPGAQPGRGGTTLRGGGAGGAGGRPGAAGPGIGVGPGSVGGPGGQGRSGGGAPTPGAGGGFQFPPLGGDRSPGTGR